VVADPDGLNSGRIQVVLKAILQDLNEAGIVSRTGSREAVLLVKAEIIRRILIILRLSFIEGVNDWNHVLPVQLNALDEVEVLFSDS